MADFVTKRRADMSGGLMSRFQEQMNNMCGRFATLWPFDGGAGMLSGDWVPAMDIADREDALIVRADLPGMKAEDIDISVQGNVLTVSGQRKECCEKKGEDYYHVERRCGAFRRDVTLGSAVDAEKIKAEYHDGVLEITLPKSEAAKPRKVQIKT